MYDTKLASERRREKEVPVVMAKLTKKVAFLTVAVKSWASLKETTWC